MGEGVKRMETLVIQRRGRAGGRESLVQKGLRDGVGQLALRCDHMCLEDALVVSPRRRFRVVLEVKKELLHETIADDQVCQHEGIAALREVADVREERAGNLEASVHPHLHHQIQHCKEEVQLGVQ